MGIRSRLDELPAYVIQSSQIHPNLYSLVHTALKHLGKSIRLELPRLRSLDLILEEDAWVVVDRDLNDIPIIAWVEFVTKHRTALHEPITCERRMYHAHALVIVDKVIEAMQIMLGEKLAQLPVSENKVSPIHRGDKDKY